MSELLRHCLWITLENATAPNRAEPIRQFLGILPTTAPTRPLFRGAWGAVRWHAQARLIYMNYNFEPINCRACGKLIWRGLSSSGFDTKLDTARLNVAEEIIKILQGARTYECHKTVVSFEAVRRTSSRIAMGTNPNAITLATHLCSTMHLFETPDMAPAYWGKPKPIQEYEGVPF
jgi:hypothetical protein